MFPHLKAWPRDSGEETGTQPSTGMAGSIGGGTIGGVRSIQAQTPGMEKELEAERIEGAFGFEFGQRFSGEKEVVVPAEVKNFWSDYLKGKWWYKVQPKTPNRLFSDYYLLLTPKSSSIVGILAVKDYSQIWSAQSGIEPDLTECLQDRNAVFSILKRKYYSESSTPNFESRLRHRGGDTLGIFSIDQKVVNENKKRWVSVHCNGILDLRRASYGRHLRLTIVYGDLEMNELHNKEVGEYVLESNDLSGF